MGTPQKNGKIALGRTASYNGTGTPTLALVCDAGNIEAEPVNYERINNVSPDDIGIQPAGFDLKFSASGIEPDCAGLGYLMWLALGSQVMTVGDEHEMVPAEQPQYAEVFVDRGLDLGSSTPTETAIGAMIESFDLDVQVNQFVKMGIAGIACNFGALYGSLTASFPDHPLSWHGLRAGDFKINYNGAGLVSDRTIKGTKLSYSREIDTKDNITLDDDQPIGATAFGRTLEFELTRQFFGANAKSEYLAWKNQQTVGIQLSFSMNSGAETVLIDIPVARPVGSYAGAVGAGNDSIMATMKCKAYKEAAGDDLFTVTVDDGTTVLWT